MECFRNGAPIYRRKKSGRRNKNVAQTPFAKNRLYCRPVGRSCRQRSGRGSICGALSGFARETRARNKKLDRPAGQKFGALSSCKSVSQNFCALFANKSGGSG